MRRGTRGAGAGREVDGGCRSAASAALSQLAEGQGVSEAAIVAVVVLDDATIELDAFVMDTRQLGRRIPPARGEKPGAGCARC